MIRFCRTAGHDEWAYKHLLPECRRRLANGNGGLIGGQIMRFFSSDEDLLSTLDRIAAVADEEGAKWDLLHWANEI